MTRRRDGRQLGMVVVGLVALLGWGCERGSSRVSEPSGTTTVTASERGGKTVTVNLRDRFLVDHNAGHFGGRTFRWLPPIPIHISTGDPLVDDFLLQQFLAWEGALAGAGGVPFYEVRPLAEALPERGIFLVVSDLPGDFVGLGDPFSPLAESRRGRSAIMQGLRQRGVHAPARQREVPEIRAGGDIQRCVIVLDPTLENASDTQFAGVVRHEIGHCLGFIGHVARGLMAAKLTDPGFSLAIRSDVSGMMQRLYRLPPGSPVTR